MSDDKGIAVRCMTLNDLCRAENFLNFRVRKKIGNEEASFPLEILPKTGLSCFEDGKLLAVATCYLERSAPVAVCGWCISAPGNTPQQSKRAVRALLAAMPDYASSFGARYLLTTFGNRGINRIAADLGYKFGEKCVNMFMFLEKKE